MMLVRNKEAGGYRFISASNGLVGWIRKDLPENIFMEFVRDPDGSMEHAPARVMKDGTKTKVVSHILQDQNGIGLRVVTKRFHYGSGFRRLGFFFFPSPALRSLKGALLLRSKDLLAPAPLAALEYRDWEGVGTSYYMSEEVTDSRSLHAFWQAILRELPAKRRLAVGRSVLRELARLLSALHFMGIYHRDLKASNILIQEGEGEKRRIFLVDLDRVQQRRRVPLSKRVKNLLQVRRRAWSSRDQIFFLLRYAEGFRLSKTAKKTLARKLLCMIQKRDALRQREREQAVQG